MVVTLGQQYNVGEKPTVVLYSYINRHAGPPNKTKQKTMQYMIKRVVVVILPYTIIIVPSITPYNNRGLGQP